MDGRGRGLGSSCIGIYTAIKFNILYGERHVRRAATRPIKITRLADRLRFRALGDCCVAPARAVACARSLALNRTYM
jgi:hypothetical protein